MKFTFNIINLFLLAGACLLLMLTILGGSSDHSPLNKIYFLKADTSGIPGAFEESAWTFWGVCDANDFSNCTRGPAYPISPKDNWHTTEGVPSDFIDNRNTYYYLSIFGFVFTIITIGFIGVAFLIDFFGLCFGIIDKIVIYFVILGLFFSAGAAAFYTSVIILAKNAFHDEKLYAHVSTNGMAIIWTTFAVILIITFITCHANILNSYKNHIERVRAQTQNQIYSSYPEDLEGGERPVTDNDASSFVRSQPAEQKEEDTSSGGVRFFKIKRKGNTTNPSKISDEEESL